MPRHPHGKIENPKNRKYVGGEGAKSQFEQLKDTMREVDQLDKEARLADEEELLPSPEDFELEPRTQPARMRMMLSVTLDPSTADAIARLGYLWGLPRGRVVDKVFEKFLAKKAEAAKAKKSRRGSDDDDD